MIADEWVRIGQLEQAKAACDEAVLRLTQVQDVLGAISLGESAGDTARAIARCLLARKDMADEGVSQAQYACSTIDDAIYFAEESSSSW